jgi:hypothetical protein
MRPRTLAAQIIFVRGFLAPCTLSRARSDVNGAPAVLLKNSSARGPRTSRLVREAEKRREWSFSASSLKS